MKLSKLELEGKLEPSLLKKMRLSEYDVEWTNPKKLVKWNRLDVSMRTLFLNLKNKLPDLANEIYFEDIKAQTLGSVIDPDNSEKYNFDIFKNEFNEIETAIGAHGFDAALSLIPLATNGSILNGSHRLSSAIFHNKDVACIQTHLPPIRCDSKYFFERAVPSGIIDQSVVNFLSLAENCFLAVLWPSGSNNMNSSERLFSNIIFKKRLSLTLNGRINLLFQCYKHMDWIGDEKSGYKGLNQKLVECFPKGGDPLIIAFQEDGGLDAVRSIKSKVRQINGIGFSSIHITDSQSEAIDMIRIICNDNGMHYLNHAQLIEGSHEKVLMQIGDEAHRQGICLNDFLVDGSWLLELYGLRKANDVDLLVSPENESIYERLGFDSREKEVVHHGKTADALIYDPNNHFFLNGVKIIGFQQLYSMKRNRSETKDLLDLQIMDGILTNDLWARIRVQIAQKYLFARIRVSRRLFKIMLITLKLFGIYKPVRAVYREIRKLNEHRQ